MFFVPFAGSHFFQLQKPWVGSSFDRDFKDHRPATQHWSAQAQKNALADHSQSFDVKAVVFTWNRHKPVYMLVTLQSIREHIALVVPLQLRCWMGRDVVPFGIFLQRKASQQKPIATGSDLGQPLRYLLIGSILVLVRQFSLQAMGTDQP